MCKINVSIGVSLGINCYALKNKQFLVICMLLDFSLLRMIEKLNFICINVITCLKFLNLNLKI